MPKLVKFSFQKGVLGTLEPRLMGDGYAMVIHNCDLRTGGARPHKAPVLDGQAVTAGTVNMFEFLGSWYFSPEIRDWAAEKYGNMVRVYYTIPGQSTALPQKIIDGTQARLGTKPPSAAPTVKSFQGTSSTIITVTADMLDPGSLRIPLKKTGTYRYRLAAKNQSGKIIATSSVLEKIITLPDTYYISLSYVAPEGIGSVEVYRNDVTAQGTAMYYLGDGVSGAFEDTEAKTLDFAKPFPSDVDTQTPFQYFYTYVRDINGHVDESGPSPLSEWVEGPNGREILFEGAGTGSFTPDATHTYANPVATPIAGTTSFTTQSFISSGGESTIVTTAAHGLASGAMVRLTSTYPTDPSGVYQITVPTALVRPLGVNFTVVAKNPDGLDPQGTITPGSHVFQIVAVRGWDVYQVGSLAPGAMSLPSATTTLTITAGDSIKFTAAPIDCDAYFLYQDSVLVGTFPASMVNGGNALWTGSPGLGGQGSGWTGSPALPVSDKTASTVFKITAALSPQSQRPTQLPSFDVGGGVQIATAAHGYSIGSRHSVRLSGFATNTALNATWTATVTGTTTAKINTSMSGSSETGTLAEFGTADAGTSTDETANITARRLYRIGDVTEFLLVAEVAIEEPSYIDTVETVNLGNGPTSYYVENGIQVIFAPPPANLEKIVMHNGGLVGISGNQVRWTPINAPDAWPEIFTMSPGSQPMNLKSVGGSVIVFCLDHIGRLEMGSPTQVLYQKSLAEQGCIAPYSVAQTMRGIVYLSAEGLMMFDAAANGSWPIFGNRLVRNFFLAPSVPTTAFGHWWTPANKSFGYTFLGRDLPGTKRAGMVAQFDTRPTFPTPFLSPRGFYANGRYYLYYAGESYSTPADNVNYSHHAMLEVDLRTPEPVGTFLGLRPMAAWVTEVGNPYLLIPGAVSGDGVSSLPTSIALAGSAPDTDGGLGGALATGTPKLFRFLDEAGTRSRIEIRTGPLGAVLNDRVRWHSIDVHGTGSGTLKVYVDGWDATAAGAAQFVASETPTQARRVNLPNSAVGYYLDLELAGDLNFVCYEVAFSLLEEEVL